MSESNQATEPPSAIDATKTVDMPPPAAAVFPGNLPLRNCGNFKPNTASRLIARVAGA